MVAQGGTHPTLDLLLFLKSQHTFSELIFKGLVTECKGMTNAYNAVQTSDIST